MGQTLDGLVAGLDVTLPGLSPSHVSGSAGVRRANCSTALVSAAIPGELGLLLLPLPDAAAPGLL